MLLLLLENKDFLIFKIDEFIRNNEGEGEEATELVHWRIMSLTHYFEEKAEKALFSFFLS